MHKYMAILLLMYSSIATAAHVMETGKITTVIAEGSNVISVMLDGNDNTSQCTGGGRWTLYTDDPLYKEKYSLLLMAAASGKTVKLLHIDGSGCGGWDSNRIYYVITEF